MSASPQRLDCAIIGAGPGGLTAAMYLRRFHRDVVLLDAGGSRARWIPESNNCPGFPSGISGVDLLATLRAQATRFGIEVTETCVTALEQDDGGFVLGSDDGTRWAARRVILATGVIDILPNAPWVDAAIECMAMRLCAICDGYEATDQTLAAYGPFTSALSHARFLRTFSTRVCVVSSDQVPATEAQRGEAAEAGIELLGGRVELGFDGSRCLATIDGRRRAFDALYPVLGSNAQSMLATGLGARVDDNGELLIDADKMTSIDGLYAIGDVACAINQISVATGQAAIAATSVHNALPANMRARAGATA